MSWSTAKTHLFLEYNLINTVSHGCSVNLANGDVTEEGALRGDKGAKNETDVDQNSYLMRAIQLARGEAYLLACAFFCLGLSSASSLILPSYQVFIACLHLSVYQSYYLGILAICFVSTSRSSFSTVSVEGFALCTSKCTEMGT